MCACQRLHLSASACNIDLAQHHRERYRREGRMEGGRVERREGDRDGGMETERARSFWSLWT